MVCPKCGSDHVLVQQVQTGSVGMSQTSVKSHAHGLFYWLFVGWWLWIFKLIFLPFKVLFGHSKKTGKATTISGTKAINSTKAVCQNCGHTWRV